MKKGTQILVMFNAEAPGDGHGICRSATLLNYDKMINITSTHFCPYWLNLLKSTPLLSR